MLLLISNEIEIDLRDCLTHDPFRFNGEVRAYLPSPYNQHAYLPLAKTQQRFGQRTWFLCTSCNRKVGKLYALGRLIACRHCHNLRYDSQYRKNPVSKRSTVIRRLETLQKHKRRLWYGDKPTQFGKRLHRLREDVDRLNKEVLEYYESEAEKDAVWLKKLKSLE